MPTVLSARQLGTGAVNGDTVADGSLGLVDLDAATQAQIAGQPGAAWLLRNATRQVAGDVAGVALNSGGGAISRYEIVFVPFIAPATLTLAGLSVAVTVGRTGTVALGLYANARTAGEDAPAALLAQTAGLDTGADGAKDGNFVSGPLTLLRGQIYWVGMLYGGGSTYPTIHSLAEACCSSALGRRWSDGRLVTHLRAAATLPGDAALPNPAPATLVNGIGSPPAIYLLRA